MEYVGINEGIIVLKDYMVKTLHVLYILTKTLLNICGGLNIKQDKINISFIIGFIPNTNYIK